MTSHWPTCFKLAAAIAFACSLNAGTVTGAVELRDSRESAVQKARNFSGVVVWLEPATGSPAAAGLPPGHGRTQQILQKGKKFSPHILAVAVGTTVDFPNLDPIFHNAFSTFEGQVFDIGLYPPGSTRAVRFDRPGIVRVFCNIHPTMSALIAVLNTPYFAVSRADGSYAIPNVPPGEYIVRVFHERATPAHLQELNRRAVVMDTPLSLPRFEISESGYLPVAHKNKYGKPYPAVDENMLYPGARK